MYTSYVVVVASQDGLRIAAEVLMNTKDVAQAVHAMGVFLLFAPDAHVSLFMCDEVGQHRVLQARNGVWRVKRQDLEDVAA